MGIEKLVYDHTRKQLIIESTGERVLLEPLLPPTFQEVPLRSSLNDIDKAIREKGELWRAHAYYWDGPSIKTEPYIHEQGKGHFKRTEIRFRKETYPVCFFKIIQRFPV